MAKQPTISEVLATGTDAEKQRRIRDLEPEARHAIESGIEARNSKLVLQGLDMLVDAALLAHSIADDKLHNQYNPSWAAFEAYTSFGRAQQVMPSIVKDNQEQAFPFLLALGMLLPSEFAYVTAWHILAEQDVVRDPHERAAIGNRHLKFYAEALEPFLYKEMFEARDRGDIKTYENLGVLWESNLQHMFLIHRSSATHIVRRRLRAEDQKASPAAEKQALLGRMKVTFDAIDKVERERRLRLAQKSGENPSTHMFGDAAKEVAATTPPTSTAQLISGTPAARELRDPKRAIKMLTKFKPPEGSKPN